MKNRQIKIFLRYMFALICTVILMSCSDFLDKKSSSALAVPESVKDLRAMLDYEWAITTYYPALAEMGSDDYYIPYATLVNRPEAEQLIYTWQRDEMRMDMTSWTQPYHVIMICNIVLETLARGVEGRDADKIALEGEAHFVRSFAYYFLAQVFCEPYDEGSSDIDLGLPLRVSSDVNQSYSRASVKETYSLIIEGLKMAIQLLPETSSYKTRPTKAAAYGALARVYLSMAKYEEANQMAMEALHRHSELIDYNTLNISRNFPFEVFHKEIIYYGATNNGLLIADSRARTPWDLFSSYDDNDLRKEVFFNSSDSDNIVFKGYYAGISSSYFAGIATDELYLIRAECEVRKGEIGNGLAFLNTLMETRWKAGTFEPFDSNNAEDALRIILGERRKQLVRRGMRWTDLRRLNKDSRFAETLVRVIDDGSRVKKYELEPNALQYVYPIPYPVLEYQPYKQNPI